MKCFRISLFLLLLNTPYTLVVETERQVRFLFYALDDEDVSVFYVPFNIIVVISRRLNGIKTSLTTVRQRTGENTRKLRKK